MPLISTDEKYLTEINYIPLVFLKRSDTFYLISSHLFILNQNSCLLILFCNILLYIQLENLISLTKYFRHYHGTRVTAKLLCMIISVVLLRGFFYNNLKLVGSIYYHAFCTWLTLRSSILGKIFLFKNCELFIILMCSITAFKNFLFSVWINIFTYFKIQKVWKAKGISFTPVP